jgi:hypothetical protein
MAGPRVITIPSGNAMIRISGTEFHPFEEEQIGAHAPHLPGVFILAVKPSRESFRPYLVGHADNLRDTLQSLLEREFPFPLQASHRKRHAYFQCHPVLEEQYRRELELLLAETASRL